MARAQGKYICLIFSRKDAEESLQNWRQAFTTNNEGRINYFLPVIMETVGKKLTTSLLCPEPKQREQRVPGADKQQQANDKEHLEEGAGD